MFRRFATTFRVVPNRLVVNNDRVLALRMFSAQPVPPHQTGPTPTMAPSPPRDQVPTIESARKMPRNYKYFSNETILTLSSLGDQDAREERLLRHIMAVDNISWEEAEKILYQMAVSNRQGMFVVTLPYKFAIGTAVFAGFASIPMIFHLDTVLWFNEFYVTSDVPEDKDLETPLEVGSWAWNWMEPPLGQISFFLLCMQFARAQMENLGLRPFTGWYKGKRAARLVKEFPRYDAHIVEAFSKGDNFNSEPYRNNS